MVLKLTVILLCLGGKNLGRTIRQWVCYQIMVKTWNEIVTWFLSLQCQQSLLPKVSAQVRNGLLLVTIVTCLKLVLLGLGKYLTCFPYIYFISDVYTGCNKENLILTSIYFYFVLWNEAQLSCASMHGSANLASINSLEENEFVTEQLASSGATQSAWIGMYRRNLSEKTLKLFDIFDGLLDSSHFCVDFPQFLWLVASTFS